MKNPYLSTSGTADVKSNAEIYVNDKFVSSTSLNPGPYTINNIGSGQTSNNDVKIVVKDINGNLVQVNNISLIGSSYNLKKGDKVVAGQLIGTVASPSAYYIEEGPGVYFKLTQYGEPINPDTYFVE